MIWAEIPAGHSTHSAKVPKDLLSPCNVKDDCLQKEQLKPWFDGVKKINNPVISSYLQILLLTGARRNELATLKWSDVDLQWIPLGFGIRLTAAVRFLYTPYISLLLNKFPRVNDYVFSSPTANSGYITEPRKAHNQALNTVKLPPLACLGGNSLVK